MEERIFGFAPSIIDGTEHIYSTDLNKLPAHYSYKRFLPSIIDQGTLSICVPCSLSAYLNWKENLNTGSKKDNKIKYMDIYNARTNYGDGMSFKEALHYLRHHGVQSNAGTLKIDSYAMIKNEISLKAALIANGPCIGGLPVYNYSNEFWKKNPGDSLIGGHAISIAGYDDTGFLIRNSWGRSFGDNGYTHIKYEDLKSFYEIWTIIE